MSEELPKIKPFNLRRVFSLKKKISDALECEYLGVILNGDLLRELSISLSRALPGEIPAEVMLSSLEHLYGSRLSSSLIRTESWRLAGNIELLKNNYPVRIWSKQDFPEWVPVQIVDCTVKRTDKRKKLGAEFQARILAGTSCTLLTRFFWTQGFCSYFSQSLGFSPPWRELPFKRMDEFVGLRFYCLMDGGSGSQWPSAREYPRFHHAKATPSLVKYNTDLLRRRARIGFQCPKQYEHKCFQCYVGYDQCPLATHARTYVKGHCVKCAKRAWFEKHMLPLGICTMCTQKSLVGATNKRRSKK